MSKTATLKKFFADKGYGFLNAQSESDVFFHINDSKSLNPDLLNEGVSLSYEEIVDKRSGKIKAINIEIQE